MSPHVIITEIPLRMHFATEEEYREWLIESLKARADDFDPMYPNAARLMREAATCLEGSK